MGDEDGGHQHGSVQAGGDATSSHRAPGGGPSSGDGGAPSSATEAEATHPSAEAPVIAASRWSVSEPGDDGEAEKAGSSSAGTSRAGKRGRVATAPVAAAGALSVSDLDILRELDSELQMPPSSSASVTVHASTSAKRSKKLRRVWWPDQQPGGGDDGGEGDGEAEAGFSVRTSKKVGVHTC